MSTFVMLGKYNQDSAKGISSARTEKANNLMKKFGGEVKSVYALLGDYDLVITADFPGIEEAMKASLSVSKLTGISFSTSPAVSVDAFDKLAAAI